MPNLLTGWTSGTPLRAAGDRATGTAAGAAANTGCADAAAYSLHETVFLPRLSPRLGPLPDRILFASRSRRLYCAPGIDLEAGSPSRMCRASPARIYCGLQLRSGAQPGRTPWPRVACLIRMTNARVGPRSEFRALIAKSGRLEAHVRQRCWRGRAPPRRASLAG